MDKIKEDLVIKWKKDLTDFPRRVGGGFKFVVAANGTFVRKEMWWADAVVPASKIPFLEEEKEGVSLKLPPISGEQVKQIIAFFREVYRRYKAEAVVLLDFERETGRYKLVVPKQTVSGGSARYDGSGRAYVASVHSHASMSAFHSGTDRRDESMAFDGVHVTIGDMQHNPHLTISSEVVIGGKRYKLDPKQFLEGIEEVEYRRIQRLTQAVWGGATAAAPNAPQSKPSETEGVGEEASQKEPTACLPTEESLGYWPGSGFWSGRSREKWFLADTDETLFPESWMEQIGIYQYKPPSGVPVSRTGNVPQPALTALSLKEVRKRKRIPVKKEGE